MKETKIKNSDKNPAKRKQRSKRRTCNICGQSLKTSAKYARFCLPCKARSDVYRFATWFGGEQLS